MKRVRRFCQFAHTLTTSALNEWRITGRVKWRTATKIVSALFYKEHFPHGPGSFWWRRMRACQRCAIYDKRRKACGLIGQTYQRGSGISPLGCGCYLPLKTSVRDAECWLWEQTDGQAGVDWSDLELEPPVKRR